MNDFELPFHTERKYLRLIFDNITSWLPNIYTLCSKLSSRLFVQSRFDELHNSFLMRLIYTSLIESRLRFDIVVWGSASCTALKQVFRLQSRAICVVAGVDRNDYLVAFLCYSFHHSYLHVYKLSLLRWLCFRNVCPLQLRVQSVEVRRRTTQKSGSDIDRPLTCS